MTILDDVRKKFGENSIISGSENRQSIPVIPTGSLALDIALGVGGIPRGRIIEIYGPQQSGKTSLCQYIVANCQMLGGKCAYVDMEHVLDYNWMAQCGVNVSELEISQPDYGEMALEITEMLARSKEFDLIIVDSVAALVPKAEIEGEMGDSHMGMQARLMGQALRKINPALSQSNCTVIFINQLRQKIGVVWGSPETTTGGTALPYYASIRIDLRAVEPKKEDGEQTGNKIKATIKKNKVASPYKTCLMALEYGVGFDYYQEVIDLAVELNIVEKSSRAAWYTFEEIKRQGDLFKTELVNNNSLFQRIEDNVRLYYGLPLRRIE